MEKKLEVLKRALELGAKIDINFHGNGDLHQAEQKAKEVSDMLGKEIKYYARNNSQWYETPRTYDEVISVASFGPNLKDDAI